MRLAPVEGCFASRVCAHRSPAGAIVRPQGGEAEISGQIQRRATDLGQCRPQLRAAAREHLGTLGPMLISAQQPIDPGSQTGEIVVESIKHALDLELLAKPGARKASRPHGRTDHTARGAAGELLPQIPAVASPAEIQGDQRVVKAMIVGETAAVVGMNELVNQIWDTLGFDDPLSAGCVPPIIR